MINKNVGSKPTSLYTDLKACFRSIYRLYNLSYGKKSITLRSYLKAIGIDTIVKITWIFLLYGFLTTLYIHFTYGLNSELPIEVSATLENPISMYTFGWLGFLGLTFHLFATNFGKLECNLETRRPRRVFWFSLPLCEAAISLGVVICATLLGIAFAVDLVSAPGSETDKTATLFYMLFMVSIFFNYPIAYFTMLFMDSQNIIKTQLNIMGSVYIISMSYVLYIGLPFKQIIEIAAIFSVLMVIYYFIRKFIIKPSTFAAV